VRTPLSFKAVGHATSLFLALTFILCVAFDRLLPGAAMFPAFQSLLPGFRWTDWRTFLLGLIESYYYGWYFALVWVPLYNLFCRWQTSAAAASGPEATR